MGTIILIAVGLSMDAFAVSICSGAQMEKPKKRYVLKIATAFGLFQAIMPLIGWLLGSSMKSLIEDVDHWIALGLLTFVGGKMIYEAVRNGAVCRPVNFADNHILLMLAIATSIDALAVGITLNLLDMTVYKSVIIIGLITFLFSTSGVYIGKYFGSRLSNKVEVLGGLILIGIGFKILFSHLLP